MKWSSAISESVSLSDAVLECSSKIRDELAGGAPDLVIAFVSVQHSERYGEVASLIEANLPGGLLVGCSGGGVIGDGREVEQRPGFAMTAVQMPNVDLTPFHIEDDALPDGDAAPEAWQSLVTAPGDADGDRDTIPEFLLLADPFSMRGDHLLTGLDYAFPKSVKIGGLASGAQHPGGNALYLKDKMYGSGVVGVAMHGDIVVDTVVAQGCRPIGSLMIVTACDRNTLLELDGRTPFEVLRELFDDLSDADRDLAGHSLFLGVVMDELQESPKLGDYLIRNIMGIDPKRGALTIGEMLKEGQMVQFHLRDAATSAQNLSAMLDQYMGTAPPFPEAGALLFSCLGRGAMLYGSPDHDTDMFREKVGQMPLTGFFCNGEIGPVGGSTYLHGYTSSFGIFRPKNAPQREVDSPHHTASRKETASDTGS